jgi:MYXO-CTERM domain-containing protein
MITVEGGSTDGGADTSGSGGNDTNNDTNNDSGNDTSSEGGGSEDSGATGTTDDEGGCACNTTGDSRGAAFMLLGLVGLGLSRRRARR